ncbi:MAG: SPOR domain-containing protein [Sphingopyxis sp.]|uniref:tetratricopeptide repeat protein n=1 Tax=Sphingopyxis sp. TaxID=1908224 RepID=UPI002ABAEE14|nr:SPOR domain-containing protein [Sphingopyxis sp.]MDZ3832633.1 SPOR domain-containing protein [Sphingopyxis sp.]
MRLFRLTARPGGVRHHVAALGALFLSTAALTPVQAMQAAGGPDAATKAAMDKRAAARTLLSSALARIAANSNDASALLDAGRASIDLDDHRAALSFLLRAEQIAPRDAAVKAALGSAMVHMENPTRALDYFGEAQLLGAPERLLLADRGLARDLLGQQDAAQRDYQLALTAAPSVEVTRRYAISLGISGDPDRAVQLLTPQLRTQDRGAWRTRAMVLAMNGREVEATEIVNATMPAPLAKNILPYLVQMDRLNPAQQAAAAHFGRFPEGQLGPKRKPVQMAAATPAPAAVVAPAQKPRRRDGAAEKRPSGAVVPAPVRTAAATPAPRPVPAKPAPAPAPVAAAAPTPSTPAPIRSAPALTAPPKPASVSTLPSASSTSAAAAARPSSAPTSPVGAVINSGSGPVGPGFSINENPPAAAPPLPPGRPAPASATPPSAPLASMASLGDIIGSIEIPAEEMERQENAVGADVLARLQLEKRRAEAAEAAKREKEAAAAKAKAEADAKAKEEADRKKANPARQWVQIATGSNPRALAFDYNRFTKKHAALFKGKSGSTAEWGRTRRLLVGPFKDRKSAQAWLDDFKKAEGDGFLFNSGPGEVVEPIK